MRPALLRRTLGVAGIVLLAACGSDSDPTGAAANGSIRGTVSDDAGATVANAAVELSGNGQAARTTNSGADGAYTFTEVPAGTYTLAVSAPTGFTVGAAASSSLTVASGAEATAAAFVLNRVIVNGSIRGIVTDDSGVTVANATVALTGNALPARTTTSGADGAYTFENVSAGTYTLVVKPPTGFTLGATGTASVTVSAGAQASVPALVVSRLSPQAARDSAFVTALRERLQTATAADQFSGTVLVTRDGSTLFEGAYGLANREQGIANTLLTRFRVGSMNKMLTAVATLQLVQAGKLNLDATLATYLPDYPNADLASKVTLHHLLTHTGGTGDIFGPLFQANRLELRNTSDYLRLYGTRSLLFTPGTQWQYSNYGFVLLGAVIEQVTAMSYDDYIATHVLTSAGMIATGAAPEDSVVPLRAVGYTGQLVPGSLVPNTPVLPYRGSPAGGWYSTVGDFARFALAVREHRLLDAAHTALLLGGKVSIGPGEQYAYGFIDRTVINRRFVGHSGGSAGMNGELIFEPNGGYVIVVLANLDPQAAGQIAAYILSLVLAAPPGG